LIKELGIDNSLGNPTHTPKTLTNICVTNNLATCLKEKTSDS